MYACPYCGSELNRPGNRRMRRTGNGTGGKSTGHELVTCSDCDEVIDGFAAH